MSIVEQGGSNNFGLATSDNQTTEIGILNGIKTDTDSIAAATQVLTFTEVINQSNYNIFAAPYSATTNITTDYILDSFEIHFSTSQSKTITITTGKNTAIYDETNLSTDIFVSNINAGFKANENITVAISQTTGACLVTVVVRIRTGSLPILANNSLLATEATLTELLPKYTEMVQAGSLIYLGESKTSKNTALSTWRIQRINTTTGVVVTFADGSQNFDKIWDNYLTYTY